MDLLPFLAVSAVVVLVPGVDLALVTRQVLLRGRAAGLYAAAGIVTGSAVQATAAVLGLSALLAASAGVFLALKLVGAVYLVWLGAQTLWRTRPSAPAPARAPDPARSEPAVHGWRSYWAGVLTNLLNPKIVLFYVTFLPQFVHPGPGAAARTGLLALIFLAVASSWLLIYTALLQRLRSVLIRARVQRWIERVTGAVLVGLGLRLGLES
jgi:threonine/homoserine/homoserine lactone efflux protein